MEAGAEMEATAAMDHEEITVKAMNPVHRRGPVFYASMSCNDRTFNGTGVGRHRLVSALWEQLTAVESPLWKRCQAFNCASSPIRVEYGLLGRPHLLVGAYRSQAVSFSKGGGRIWAALAGDEAEIGIDAAGADDFRGNYPFHRVFHPEELHHACALLGGDPAEAAALLWSVKEAAVKALGCGFHFVDPLQITVHPAVVEENGGYTFPVGLSGKALMRFPLVEGQYLRVSSLLQGKTWLSIALLNWESTGHE